ncbi:MAG: hypothetical protein F4X80_02690 [Chloroflexi bacterium]|nr:hypothetical protein [Chloroflexota bacterium]
MAHMRSTTRLRHAAYAAMVLVVTLVAVAALGCREERIQERGFDPEPRTYSGTPRPFLLGFSSVPAELTQDAYRDALNLTARYGEVLLIQRAPEWAEFLPGVEPSERLAEVTLRERVAVEERELRLFYALDPFDPVDRGRLAAPPAGYEDADFSDPAIRAAFVAEARYVATSYEPAYLALGVEINATYERSPAQYQAFLATYREAYRAVKSVSPHTLVFATFQYEQLLGIVPWEPPRQPRWELLDDFAGRLDVFALATFPSVTYEVANDLPPLYYQQIRDHTQLPIAFASVGFASAPSPDGVHSSTPPEQRRYLQRLFTDADALAASFIVWFAGRDPAFIDGSPLDLLSSVGLRDAEDRAKDAWAVWEETASRPVETAGGTSSP